MTGPFRMLSHLVVFTQSRAVDRAAWFSKVMRLTENLTSEKSADTSGPRLESLIFYQATRKMQAKHTGLMMLFLKLCGIVVIAPARTLSFLITMQAWHHLCLGALAPHFGVGSR